MPPAEPPLVIGPVMAIVALPPSTCARAVVSPVAVNWKPRRVNTEVAAVPVPLFTVTVDAPLAVWVRVPIVNAPVPLSVRARSPL